MKILKKIFAGGLKIIAIRFWRSGTPLSVEDVDFRPAPAVFDYEPNLIDRSITQWQFGDWPGLLSISRETIEQHPERAKLALLVATANAQQGLSNEAREYTLLAKKWGCSNEIIARILIAGTYNSIGRAAALTDDADLMHHFFDLSLSTGTPGGAVDMMLRARINEQYRQLGISTIDEITKHSLIYNESIASDIKVVSHLADNNQNPNSNDEKQELAESLNEYLALNDINNREKILQAISKLLSKYIKANNKVEVEFFEIKYNDQNIKFICAKDDYIPGKIKKEDKFYESVFLEYLSKFHKKNGIIIDVGANIGNHSIFFGKVLQAEIIAIEPEPHNTFFFDFNIRINKLNKQVTLLETAVGEINGSICIEMNVRNNYGSFTAKPNANPNSSPVSDPMAIEVPVKTIDYLLINNNVNLENISIIKLDVEGMEVEALRGALSVIKKSLPAIAVECFRHEDLINIEKILKQFDYFAVEVVNATPTFVYITKKNLYHLNRYEYHLRELAVNKAAKYKGFIQTIDDKGEKYI